MLDRSLGFRRRRQSQVLQRPLRLGSPRAKPRVWRLLLWLLLRCLHHVHHPGTWVANAAAGLVLPPTRVGAVQTSMSVVPGEPRQPSRTEGHSPPRSLGCSNLHHAAWTSSPRWTPRLAASSTALSDMSNDKLRALGVGMRMQQPRMSAAASATTCRASVVSLTALSCANSAARW